MAPTPDRILTQRHCTAMAATDSIHHISQRVQNLLAAGRRITIADRYTHTEGPPDVAAGLTVEEMRPGKKGGIGVHLKPGIRYGFGIHAVTEETESEAWDRYHRNDRANLIRVDITGGLPGDSPVPDDRLVIRRWISDGVCRETVVAFDCGPRDAQDRAARWLYSHVLGDQHRDERQKAWDHGKVHSDDVALWEKRAVDLLAAIADEGR